MVHFLSALQTHTHTSNKHVLGSEYYKPDFDAINIEKAIVPPLPLLTEEEDSSLAASWEHVPITLAAQTEVIFIHSELKALPKEG